MNSLDLTIKDFDIHPIINGLTGNRQNLWRVSLKYACNAKTESFIKLVSGLLGSEKLHEFNVEHEESIYSRLTLCELNLFYDALGVQGENICEKLD